MLTKMLSRSLAAGYRAIEVPMCVQARVARMSQAGSVYNVVTALRMLAVLVWDIHARRRPLP